MIKDNIKVLEEEISSICNNCGRHRSDIKLIAVSKTQSIENIKQALLAGVNEFGENRAQELRDKSELIFDNINWHFIGHLQKNKVKYIIKSSVLIHSIDSKKLAEEVKTRAEQNNKIQNVLLEIKTSKEATKFGLLNEDEIFSTTQYCFEAPSINLIGLMTMAPFTNDEKIIRGSFTQLRNLFEKLNKNGYNLTELSMGMTNDYRIAIEEGSTMLRIGSAIFGERNY
ncbi:MAG: YggS family pyridoxal phosphate-dependent enzyme [Ignavibacteria bacterium]|nr:YggS family pyridoxal phosphate-dependent enzyme [Ignavibacteria bacterium]